MIRKVKLISRGRYLQSIDWLRFVRRVFFLLNNNNNTHIHTERKRHSFDLVFFSWFFFELQKKVELDLQDNRERDKRSVLLYKSTCIITIKEFYDALKQYLQRNRSQETGSSYSDVSIPSALVVGGVSLRFSSVGASFVVDALLRSVVGASDPLGFVSFFDPFSLVTTGTSADEVVPLTGSGLALRLFACPLKFD